MDRAVDVMKRGGKETGDRDKRPKKKKKNRESHKSQVETLDRILAIASICPVGLSE